MRKSAAAGDILQIMAAVELGTITIPSGALVLGMAGWIDYWPQTGQTLPQRAASHRGGHLRDGLCEAIAVRALSDCWCCVPPHRRRRSTASRRSPSSSRVSALRDPRHGARSGTARRPAGRPLPCLGN